MPPISPAEPPLGDGIPEPPALGEPEPWEDSEPLEPDWPEEGLEEPELPPLGVGGVGEPDGPDGAMGGVLQAASRTALRAVAMRIRKCLIIISYLPPEGALFKPSSADGWRKAPYVKFVA